MMAIDLRLIFLGQGWCAANAGVVAGFGVAAPLGHDERFVVADVPCRGIGAFGVLLVPTDVLIGADDVEGFA